VTDEVAAERELDEIEAQVEAVVEDAHKFAMNSPYPDPATVLDHVYSVEC
jgi:TPP-dependent pyruvate/acetoin dehydrogenase alpha subunit